MNKKDSKDFDKLERKMKALIDEYFPDAAWTFFLLEDKDALRGKSEEESLAFMAAHSEDIGDAIVLSTVGIKCLLFKCPDSEKDDLLSGLIKRMRSSNDFRIIDMDSNSSMLDEKERNKGFKKTSIKDYLKNKMKDIRKD